jgi:hypothetical protein
MSDNAAWSDRIVEWATRLHVEYEYQAKRFGWVSQTPVSFDELPEANKQTMLNTVASVMGPEIYPLEREIESLRAALDAALTTIEALRNIHREHGPTSNGMHCCTADREEWPCRTITILGRTCL